MTRAQFAAAVRADEKWVENAARALGRQLAYTANEARWFGLTRILAREVGIPIPHAAKLAAKALRESPDAREVSVAVSRDTSAALTLDLARYHSAFAAALSAATHHGGPRRRGRPRRTVKHGRDALAAAYAHGVDLSLLQESLALSPAERLARLDANAASIEAIRQARPRAGHRRRG